MAPGVQAQVLTFAQQALLLSSHLPSLEGFFLSVASTLASFTMADV